MRAVRWHPSGDVTLDEVDVPSNEANEIRVRVQACGVCRSDLHFIDRLWKAQRTEDERVPGHEIAGVVDACGAAVDGPIVGSRVVLAYTRSCGGCAGCRRGLSCETAARIGFAAPGGYAEYVVVPAAAAVPLPDELRFVDAAPLACAGATAVYVCRRAGMSDGDDVTVIGCGGVGLALVQVGRSYGATVTAVDSVEEKLPAAVALGAAHAQVAGETLRPADVVLDTATTAASIEVGIKSLRYGGRHVMVGLPRGRVTPDVGRLLWKHAALTTCLNSTYADLVEAVRLAAAGELRIPVADVLPLERFQDALHALAANQPVGRLILAPCGA